MSTDRELLELAAKAAGIAILWIDSFDAGHDAPNIIPLGPDECHFVLADEEDHYGAWNPLTDDGDALRLAVKLHINLEHLRSLKAMAFEEVAAAPHGRGDCLAVEPTGSDPAAATRRAIVRAAAAIGLAQEGKTP